MQYLLLIYQQEGGAATAANDEAMASELAAYGAFTADVAGAGQYIAGEALEPTDHRDHRSASATARS